jgi:hypothetical protein
MGIQAVEDEAVKILEHNQEELYEIVEREDGTVVLEIVLAAPAGAFAMYVMHVPFTPEELGRYRVLLAVVHRQGPRRPRGLQALGWPWRRAAGNGDAGGRVEVCGAREPGSNMRPLGPIWRT